MSLKEHLKLTKYRNIERMKELEEKGECKSQIEWQEYHILIDKYSMKGCLRGVNGMFGGKR